MSTNALPAEASRFDMRHALRLGRAFRLIWQSARGWTVASLTLMMIQGVLPLLSLWLTKRVLDVIAAGFGSKDASVVAQQLAGLLVLLSVTALLHTLCYTFVGFVREAHALKVADHILDVLHQKSTAVDIGYYEDAQYHDKFHRAQQEAPFRPARIVSNLGQIGQGSLALLGIVGLLFSYHWVIAALLFVAAMPGVVLRLRQSAWQFRWQCQRTGTYRQALYLDEILTRDGHAKELRLYNLGDLFRHRFRSVLDRLRQERMEMAAKRYGTDLIAQTSATAAVVGSYAFLAFRTVNGAVTLGDLVMCYQAFQKGQDLLREVLGGLAGLYEDNLFLSNFYEFLDLKPQLVEADRPLAVPRLMREGIVFHDVGFQYGSESRKILQKVRLRIRPGEVVALVGDNGSGKTSLIKLLCRLYDPSEGHITVDGIDLRQFAIADWRREVSVIFQDYARYQLPAWENIWLGDANRPPSREQIVSVARDVGADGAIQALARGYDTVLGKRFAEGEELSIGGWQKVALARAFLRPAQILVLDEPTSSIDPQCEDEIVSRFHRLVAGRSAVLISHRLSTVRMADSIYVLQDGSIKESGTHEVLMRHGGIYARLFETQARRYR